MKTVYKNKVVKIVEYNEYLISKNYAGFYTHFDVKDLNDNFIKSYKRLHSAKTFAENYKKLKEGK